MEIKPYEYISADVEQKMKEVADYVHVRSRAEECIKENRLTTNEIYEYFKKKERLVHPSANIGLIKSCFRITDHSKIDSTYHRTYFQFINETGENHSSLLHVCVEFIMQSIENIMRDQGKPFERTICYDGSKPAEITAQETLQRIIDLKKENKLTQGG